MSHTSTPPRARDPLLTSLPPLLADRGMSLRTLSEAIGLTSPSYLSHAMHGTSKLTVGRLEQIAQVLEVEPSHFAEYREMKAVERVRGDQALADRVFDAAPGRAADD